MTICGVGHPNLGHIKCGRVAATPRTHNGPCAAVCCMVWGDGVNSIVQTSEIMSAVELPPQGERCASTHDVRREIRCSESNGHDGNHVKRVTLEWEFNKHGRIKRSAVVDGRVEDLELRYGGPVEAVIPDDDLTPISDLGPDQMEKQLDRMQDELEEIMDQHELDSESEDLAREAEEESN